MDPFERARAALEEIVREYEARGSSTDMNEATTRLRVIDRLLFECLGWDRDDCTSEERVESSFVDYALRCPQCLLIVEAKREGIYFEVPAGSAIRKRDLTYFVNHAPDVANAVRQAMEYCQDHGTPFGAVCNGHQLIAFVASRSDGCPPCRARLSCLSRCRYF